MAGSFPEGTWTHPVKKGSSTFKLIVVVVQMGQNLPRNEVRTVKDTETIVIPDEWFSFLSRLSSYLGLLVSTLGLFILGLNLTVLQHQD